jgi:hypothetical protein
MWKGGEDRKAIVHEKREHNSFLVLYDVKTGLGCTSIASIPMGLEEFFYMP